HTRLNYYLGGAFLLDYPGAGLDQLARGSHPDLDRRDLEVFDDGFDLRAQRLSSLMRCAVDGHGVLKRQRGDGRGSETAHRRESLYVGQRARATRWIETRYRHYRQHLQKHSMW